MTLAELESLAREVHPNGWESCESSLLRDGWTSDFAAYIAALSPERVLALLDVIEAAKAQDAQFSRVLHELAGAASVCWKDGAVPTGEFDSTQACEHVANAVEELRGYMSAALDKLGELK